jgi:DNA-binding transcriptional LysR family regulator
MPVGALNGEKFVGFEKGIPTRQALDRLFTEKQIAVQYVAELDNIEMVKRLVEVGAGVAVIPEKSCIHEVQSGSLVKVEMTEKELIRPIGIIHRTGKHFSPAAERFIEYLQKDPAATASLGGRRALRKASAS